MDTLQGALGPSLVIRNGLTNKKKSRSGMLCIPDKRLSILELFGREGWIIMGAVFPKKTSDVLDRKIKGLTDLILRHSVCPDGVSVIAITQHPYMRRDPDLFLEGIRAITHPIRTYFGRCLVFLRWCPPVHPKKRLGSDITTDDRIRES